MGLSKDDWHERFTQQASWTKDLRDYLFRKIKKETHNQVLEVGCGTGAILADLPSLDFIQFGLDIDRSKLKAAMRNSPETDLIQADAHILPLKTASFDLTLCHFLLLWVTDPKTVVNEMIRVTRPNGFVVALAEPDHHGRIDYPEHLVKLGEWQMQSLHNQGADLKMGRKLADIFNQSSLVGVETGILGGQWSGSPDWDSWESEWQVMESDLQNSQKTGSLHNLKELDKLAYEKGERVLFVPTFYAIGRVSYLD